MRKVILLLLALLICLYPFQAVKAQEDQSGGPVYVIQSGDSLTSIAFRFGVSVDDLIRANQLANPDILSAGMELVIPGLEGVSGKLITEIIPIGETMRSLTIRHQILPEQILRLNRITSPQEIYAGASLILPLDETTTPPSGRLILSPGESLFTQSIANNLNPWQLTETNLAQSVWDVLPGEHLFSYDDSGETISLIHPKITEIEIDALPLIQGRTVTLRVNTVEPLTLGGSLAGYDLRFFADGENSVVALQGVHGMASAGIYPLVLTGSFADGSTFEFEQMVVLQAAGYAREDINGVDPATLDPEINRPENELIDKVIAAASPEKYWDGPFMVPGYDPNWITSWYGTRRSYNGSPYTYYHSGLDYGGGTGLEVKSPAPGVIVFTDFLTVRGNATIIDHGWGIYSGFWHQSEIQVEVGDRVETGQVIGLVGGTGRITGPHLHWELWVNQVPVDPEQWLVEAFP